MTKFHRVIEIAGGVPFDRADRVFQNADDVVFLRNYLVHFKTEWHKSGVKQNEAAIVEKLLRPRFDGNVQQLSPWFPNMCLGAGCARWAHGSVTVFVHAWLDRVRIQRDINADVAALEKSWVELDAELGSVTGHG